MCSFVSTPRKEDRENGKPSRTKREPRGEAVSEMAGYQIMRNGNPSLVGHENKPHWQFAKRMLEGLVQQDQIGSAEPVIRVTGQKLLPVDVAPAQRGLEIERHGGA